MKNKPYTISQLFCDTYVRKGDVCSYIMLPALIVNKVLAQNPSIILAPTGKASNIVEFEGEPAYKIRHKCHKSILARGDNPLGLYGAINSIFSDAAIKLLFQVPNVWLLNHNARARKQRATDIQRYNYAKKHNPEGVALHHQCADRMRNMSVSQATRYTRRLSASAA